MNKQNPKAFGKKSKPNKSHSSQKTFDAKPLCCFTKTRLLNKRKLLSNDVETLKDNTDCQLYSSRLNQTLNRPYFRSYYLYRKYFIS